MRRSVIIKTFLLLGVAIAPGLADRLQAQPSPSLANFWNTNAVWASDSNNIGASFGFHCLAAITNDAGIWAYYIHNYSAPGGLTKSATGRARSTDGLKWTDDGIVMDVGGKDKASATNGPGKIWDDRLATFPGIWKDGDIWYLVYEGAAEDIPFSPGDIGLATSTDGKNFYKHPGNPILRHNTNGWEAVNIGTPSLYKEKDTWYLFYHGYDGTFCRVGVATGNSLTNLTKYSGNPVVDVASGTNAWDSGSVGKRTVAKEGAFYYMAFEGSTRPPYDKAKWSSGLARSTNLLAWTKFPANPVIPQTDGGFGFDATEVIPINGSWYMYVRTSDETAPTKRFRLAPRK
ncbi:MAG: hypothetical protein JWM68_5388 [Verrucomicrobiales bacterium]|nr:hypothetical protein [Verrucomicrobiales bacterium]